MKLATLLFFALISFTTTTQGKEPTHCPEPASQSTDVKWNYCICATHVRAGMIGPNSKAYVVVDWKERSESPLSDELCKAFNDNGNFSTMTFGCHLFKDYEINLSPRYPIFTYPSSLIDPDLKKSATYYNEHYEEFDKFPRVDLNEILNNTP